MPRQSDHRQSLQSIVHKIPKWLARLLFSGEAEAPPKRREARVFREAEAGGGRRKKIWQEAEAEAGGEKFQEAETGLFKEAEAQL